MKPGQEQRLKSVLNTLLVKEKAYKNIYLYSTSFLCWLVSTYVCHTYFFTNVNVLWTLCSALTTIVFTRYLQSKIFSERDLITTIENQLIESKVLTERDRGILAVLVDDLGRESIFLSSTQRVYNLSIMSLMYARLAHHSEVIKRHHPKFPQEVLLLVLVVTFFLAPSIIVKIDFSVPILIIHQPRELASSKKHMSISRQNADTVDELAAKLNKNMSMNQPIQRSTEFRLKQEVQKNTKLSQDTDSQSDDHQTQGDINSYIATRKTDQEKTVKSQVMMGQIGGRASGQSIRFDRHIRERQRLVEVSQVHLKAEQIIPQTNKNKASTSQASTKEIINKVLAPSKNFKSLQQSSTLTNSRRQKLRNEAYLLGSPNQEKLQNFPPALRMLIHRK